jgi:hypothetical protein
MTFKKIFLLSLFAMHGMAFSQDKPRIAVYVASEELKDNEKRMLATKILAPFVQSGHFRAIERSEAFINGIARERQKQRDGSVDDSQISRLGKESGVQFVCVADLIDAFGIYSLSARLIDTETAEIAGMGVAEMRNLGEISSAAESIYEQIVSRGSPKKAQAPMPLAPAPPPAAIAPAPAQQSSTAYKNFTAGRRWGTWALNTIVPGLGSWTIMKDTFGGFMHLGLNLASLFSFVASEKEDCYDNYNYNHSSYSYCDTYYDEDLVLTGVAFLTAGFVWNIVRSASYRKPNRHAMLDAENFNLAAIPSKNGNYLMPALFYRASF